MNQNPVLFTLNLPTLPFLGSVEAGFPSPARDHIEQPLDLTKRLVRRPAATFIFNANGYSMFPEIKHGDLLIVDRSIKPRHRHIVIAEINGEFTVKRLYNQGGFVSLNPDNPDFAPIIPEPGASLEIWGVVTFNLRQQCSD